MNLTIQYTCVIPISVDTKISDVKTTLANKFNIESNNICLMLNDEILSNDKIISDYKMDNSTTIKLFEKIRIQIKFCDENNTISVSPNASVPDVKKQLAEEFQINVDTITLRSKNKVLQDNKNLNDYQIKENSILTMIGEINVSITSSDKTVSINILSDATISYLKEQISENDEIKVKDYDLIFEEQRLFDDELLSKYKIKHKSTITIESKIKVSIMFCNESFEIEVFANANVADVKRKLSEEYQIDSNYIVLKLNSVYLFDDKTLTKYNIENNSVLIMSIKMRIFVNYCGESLEINSSSETTIDSIKTQLSMTIRMGVGSIQLYLNEQEMKNEDLLGQFGKRNKLELVMRVKITVVIQFCEERKNIEIFTDEKISDLKRKTCGQFNSTIDKMNLKFNDETLSNETRIKDYQIKDNSRLTLETMVKLNIEFFDKRDNIEINSNATINDIKNELENKYKTERRQIYLWMNERSLEDDNEKIHKYEIRNNSIIKMREKIKIKINFHNESFDFELFSDKTVSDLKKEISKKAKVSEDIIQLKLDRLFLLDKSYLNKFRSNNLIMVMTIQMNISVTFENKTNHFNISSNSIIKDLKESLEKCFHVESKYIYLDMSDRELKDKDELGCYKKESLNITMFKKESIYFNNLGKVHIILVPLNFTVKKLKPIIKEQTKIDVDIQLSYNGTNLEDERTLKSYDIENGSTVMFMSKVCGGEDI